MKRAAFAALALAIAVAFFVDTTAPSAALSTKNEGQVGDRRVVIFSVPTVRWADVEQYQPPVLLDVIGDAAVASMSIRTIGPITTLAEAYVTMGAGNRATVPEGAGGLALTTDATVEGATASVVYERRTGVPAEGSVLHLAVVEVERRADRLRYGAEPGSLGQALEDGGGSSAVVSNSDLGDPAEVGPNRPATLAVMDRDGQVAGGVVGTSIATIDVHAPFGVRLDPAATEEATRAAIDAHDVVLVEASDLVRADAYASRSTPRAIDLARRDAIMAADRLLGTVVDALDPARDLLMVVAPTGPRYRSELTVFAAQGPGFEPGLARSATTRRDGFVTLPDVAPTALDFLGIDVPDAMTGTLISASGSDAPDLGTVRSLADDAELTTFRDRAVGPVSVVYIIFQVLLYGAAVAMVITRQRWLAKLVSAIVLAVLAVPTVGFLSGLVRYDQLGLFGYVFALLGAAAAVGAIAWLVARRHPIGPPLLLIGLALAVQLVDIVTGGELQINTPFGYSPVVAGRFAGFGNLAFGVTAMAALVAGSGLWALARPNGPPQPPAPRQVLLAAAAVFAVTIAVDGLPSYGSDVGGVLATVPAFGIALALLAGWRMNWRRLAVVVIAAVVLVGAFAVVDLARPETDRTHLGRFVERLFSGDAGVIVQRKFESNISILTSSVWTWLVPFALAFLAFLIWRRTGPLRTLQAEVPGLRACLVAATALCALGMAVNDSGVAVPAMMFGVLLPYLAWLAASPRVSKLAPAAGTTSSPPGVAGR